jgi:GT2 family glycosyltransferase
MRISVVVRSKDEADRLRLTLCSLSRQTAKAEIVVVDDGSSDHTAAVIAQAREFLPMTVIGHATPKGRSGAANAGARAASGDVLLFFDGDTLAAPDCVARHAALHSPGRPVIGRGETYHLRGTRLLQNPEDATPFPEQQARLAKASASEIARLKVTRHEVMGDFAAIEARAEPSIYPGAGPRRLYDLEMDALRHHPKCPVLWAAASGNNLSVRREDFLRVGGFNESLDLNEHRELALRLCLQGAQMTPADGARSYHMTHRNGWRDPLQQTQWEEVFYRAHPIPAVKLLAIFWASLSGDGRIPREAQIHSLPQLEAAANGNTGIDYDGVRRLFPALPVWTRAADNRAALATGSA